MSGAARMTGDGAARTLAHYVNALGSDHADFVEQLTRNEHRTLQQSTMGLFLECVDAWAAKKDHEYDLRNQATVEMCRKIRAALTDDGWDVPLAKRLPCI